jgi:hypothetical protein
MEFPDRPTVLPLQHHTEVLLQRGARMRGKALGAWL